MADLIRKKGNSEGGRSEDKMHLNLKEIILVDDIYSLPFNYWLKW